MIVTEKQAAEQRCHRNPTYSMEDRAPMLPCVASKCMAWRWADLNLPRAPIRAYNRQQTEPVNRPQSVPDDWDFEPYNAETGEPAWWVPPADYGKDARRGYCGLAGIPTAEKIEA